jgi:putative hydroxymethylpyrimidine transport system substrate-binding protein
MEIAMIRRLPAILAVLLAVLAAFLTGCGDDGGGPGPAAKIARATLILDWTPNADHAGIYAAVREGFFEDAGVRVTPRVPVDAAASLREVAAGKAEFAISYEPEVLIARSEGIPVTAVGAVVTSPLNAILARADRGISRPRDLEGKTVGIAGVPSDRALLDTVVRADGGDPAKVKTATVGFTLGPSLAKGTVDAVIGAYWNVEAVELRQKGIDVTTFRLEQHGVPDYDELVLVTSDDVVRERPDLVRATLAGLARGQEWAVKNQAAAVAQLLKANKDLDQALTAEGLRLVAPLLDPPDAEPLALSEDAWARYAVWMKENGLLRKPVDAAKAVTPEFLPGA